MKVLLLGNTGQVGWQLRRSLSVLGEVVALDRHSREPSGDLLDLPGLAQAVATVRPDAVVNAAAYTAVDQAEDEPQLAHQVNTAACECLASACKAAGAWLVHYSTDYVYDGSGTRPWRESDAPAPLGVYGRTKLAGDEAVQRLLPRHLVFRTSWVFDSWGQNFARSMLRLAASRDELKVVADQWGAPTRAALIADVTAHALRQVFARDDGDGMAGVYHLAASGETTWHAYAQLVVAEAAAHGVPLRVTADRIQPIPTSAYPTKARRPANSRLQTTKLQDTFGLRLPAWQDGVRAVVAELAQPSFLPRP